MKKQNKVYSASDFQGVSSSIVIENSWWLIDHIDCTAVGEFSNTPLFELQLTQFESTSQLALPEGYEDGSSLLRRNRTYFVREGRPMYNMLAEVWEACEDSESMNFYLKDKWSKKLIAGHVERLSGVTYTRQTKRGSTIQSSKLEVWYPEDFEPGVIIDDFVFLCNKGVYTPVIEEKKSDPMMEAISKLDPKLVEAIMALKK